MAKSEEEKRLAEEEILEKQRDVDYDTKEYPVETIVAKYLTGREDETNELFIPHYQRSMAWDEPRMSKFIESVLIGIPIPYLFVADISGEGEEKEARLEIVDGSQRIRTLAKFTNNEFALEQLEKLKKLNGFYYSDLPLSRQRRFNRRTLRMIALTEKATEEVRRDLFERINTGSVELTEMENDGESARDQCSIWLESAPHFPNSGAWRHSQMMRSAIMNQMNSFFAFSLIWITTRILTDMLIVF